MHSSRLQRLPLLLPFLLPLPLLGPGCARQQPVGQRTTGASPMRSGVHPSAATGKAAGARQATGKPATTKSASKAKLRRRLRLGKALLPWTALEGKSGAPSWGAATTDAPKARDADLYTAQLCTVASGAAKPCAFALRLDKPATLHALRLYFSRGRARAPRAATALPKGLRIHVGGTYIDVDLRRRDDLHHVILSPPIAKVRRIVVEVRSLHAERERKRKRGRKPKPKAARAALPRGPKVIRLAEIDALGSGGVARPPLSVAPEHAVARTGWLFWGRRARGAMYRPRSAAWVDIVDGKGGAKRLFRGERILGRAADRFLLIRRLTGTDCECESYGPDTDYAYDLLDRRTRLFYWAALTGDVAYVSRKKSAFASTDGNNCDNGRNADRVQRLFINAATATVRRDNKSSRRGFSKMARQTETDNKCTALKKRPYRKYKGLLESDATCWRSGRFVVVHESGKPCSGSSGDKNRGTRGAIHVLDDKGRTVTRRSFKKRYDAMKARALPGGPLLIEVGRNGGDAADIYTVSSKGRLRRRYINAFLALPTSPNACGSCGD